MEEQLKDIDINDVRQYVYDKDIQTIMEHTGYSKEVAIKELDNWTNVNSVLSQYRSKRDFVESIENTIEKTHIGMQTQLYMDSNYTKQELNALVRYAKEHCKNISKCNIWARHDDPDPRDTPPCHAHNWIFISRLR